MLGAKPHVLIAVLLAIPLTGAEVDPKDRLIVETVQKLESFRYDKASAKVKDAFQRYLQATAGAAEFVDLVDKYAIPGHEDALAKLAQERAEETLGIRAVGVLAKLDQWERLAKLIADAQPGTGAALTRAVGAASSPKLAEQLFAWAKNEALAPEVRQAAIAAMCAKPEGAKALLARAEKGELPPELHLAAGNALRGGGDPEIIAATDKLLPRPQSADARPLPPIGELAKKSGDVEKGRVVYDTLCLSCHKLGDKGVDFGPGLSEIGSKLAKEALYTAILDPSAGISFGYEGWILTLADGGQAVGFIVGETDAEVTLKMPGGVISNHPKTQITRREKMKLSLMTPNLQAAMTEQNLVDLVEFLSSMKKKAP